MTRTVVFISISFSCVINYVFVSVFISVAFVGLLDEE
jgi:hypothetical protein